VTRSWGRGWFHYTLPGAWVALVFCCLAFTPSLLPRGGILQGALCGINAAIGYGFGVAGAWVWRAFADREARAARRRSWLIFAVVASICVVISYVSGLIWQSELRDLMGVGTPGLTQQVLMPVVAVLFFVALVALSRALRHLYLWLSRVLQRWVGPKAARAVGWTLVVGGTYLVVSGLLLGSLADLANQIFSTNNGITKAGVTQPTSPQRSGGPGSLISWESLGREGRSFVGTGPSAADISNFTGTTSPEPIRAFAGLDSADDSQAQAQLAVDDLERAGGFDRSYLMVATTTGSGWVSPGAADSFEYMTGGDSAIVAMQYSFLPSWISYLVDQAKAREAGRDLFDAVYQRWLERPKNNRPKLIIFGESLGSFGAEAAFSGEQDLANRTSGALLVGPPSFNTLHQEFTTNREPASTQLQPIYQNGRIVRFDNGTASAVEPVGEPWAGTRILYVQHASDPIVWWSPALLLHAPDWMSEPPGADALPVQWLPFITFWQISADLPNAAGVPAGHGHLYTPSYVESWATVLQPPGWTAAKQEALNLIIAET